MKDVFVFLGPTLPLAAAQEVLDAVYLPPVSQGDVYRLWHRRPRAVGIIDGYFEHMPAACHKEIMWIMERGVHVFGSAGLGALRAVELEQFGMRGAGWVYEAFRDGTLEQDDEVAMVHERCSTGYRAQSEAMVNIRRTLSAATDQGIISESTRDLLAALGKALFYQKRKWPTVLAAGSTQGGDPAELLALRRWLPSGRVDQKADDAVAMLRDMSAFLGTNPPPLRVPWKTARTTTWEAARRQADRTSSAAGSPAVFIT